MIDESVALSLRAYVHASPGRPGWDAGIGWFQSAMLTVTGASLVPGFPKLPARISDGSLHIGADTYNNEMPANGTFRTAVALHVRFTTTESVSIHGNGLTIELHGPRSGGEAFDGH